MKRSSVRASLTTGATWRSRLTQHPDFVLAKHSRLDGLHHENALQDSPVAQWDAKERLIAVFAGFIEILEARVILRAFDGHRTHLLRDQPGEALVDGHSQGANTLGPQTDRRRQHQVVPVGLQQVDGTNIRIEALGDQRYHVHQRLGRLAALRGEIGNFLEG